MFLYKGKEEKIYLKNHQNPRFIITNPPLWFSVIKQMLLKADDYNFEVKIFILFSSSN